LGRKRKIASGKPYNYQRRCTVKAYSWDGEVNDASSGLEEDLVKIFDLEWSLEVDNRFYVRRLVPLRQSMVRVR
jgi:hypothetical protein